MASKRREKPRSTLLTKMKNICWSWSIKHLVTLQCFSLWARLLISSQKLFLKKKMYLCFFVYVYKVLPACRCSVREWTLQSAHSQKHIVVSKIALGSTERLRHCRQQTMVMTKAWEADRFFFIFTLKPAGHVLLSRRWAVPCPACGQLLQEASPQMQQRGQRGRNKARGDGS